jgi:hypothetical protein
MQRIRSPLHLSLSLLFPSRFATPTFIWGFEEASWIVIALLLGSKAILWRSNNLLGLMFVSFYNFDYFPPKYLHEKFGLFRPGQGAMPF